MKVQRYYFTDREQFLAIRKQLNEEKRLGGSQIGTVNRQNKYCCRRRFYMQMVGEIETPDISGKQSIKDGIAHEDYVAQLFCEKSGKKVHRENCVMTSEDAPNLFASIDRKVDNEESGLECKTANALNWDAFKGGRLPDGYVKQVKTYLKVTGLERWYVSVWVMGVAHYVYLFTTRPEELADKPEWVDAAYLVTQMELDEVNEIAKDWFEKYIDAKTPPPFDGGEDDEKLLLELHPQDNGDATPVTITNVTVDDLKRMDALKDEIEAREKEIEAIRQNIQAEMGEAQVAKIGDVKVTWKNNKPSSKTDWKAVAERASVPADIVAACTETKPGARVLRIGKVKVAA